MPALANPRHERFAQAIFKGMAREGLPQGTRGISQTQAYLDAGYKDNREGARRSASRLLTYVDAIGARVRELQQATARRTEVTVASIVDELEEAREVAKANDQASAMVAATGTKAKILGLSIERHEHGTPGSFESVDSTADYADTMLKAFSHEQLNVSDVMREMALAELARHAEAMAAIAHGTLGEA